MAIKFPHHPARQYSEDGYPMAQAIETDSKGEKAFVLYVYEGEIYVDVLNRFNKETFEKEEDLVAYRKSFGKLDDPEAFDRATAFTRLTMLKNQGVVLNVLGIKMEDIEAPVNIWEKVQNADPVDLDALGVPPENRVPRAIADGATGND